MPWARGCQIIDGHGKEPAHRAARATANRLALSFPGVSGLELRPFSDDDLKASGELLAERHRRHRAAEPLLPARFEDASAAQAEVNAVWRNEGADGMVAGRGGGRVVGYLIGAPMSDPRWGANVWIQLAGHSADDPEIVRDLYAAAAQRWLDQGRHRHYVLVPAGDAELLEAWYRLSFGQQQAHGIREVPATPWPKDARPAEPRDVEGLLQIAPLLARHQARSPVFATCRRDEDIDALRAEFEKDVRSDDIGTLVAEVDDRIVGHLEVVPVELSSMHAGLAKPEGACYISWAATVPEMRGAGVGRALTSAAFAWAHEAGYQTIVTDWRVTNLLASRFWPRRGFRLTFLRLYRSIP